MDKNKIINILHFIGNKVPKYELTPKGDGFVLPGSKVLINKSGQRISGVYNPENFERIGDVGIKVESFMVKDNYKNIHVYVNGRLSFEYKNENGHILRTQYGKNGKVYSTAEMNEKGKNGKAIMYANDGSIDVQTEYKDDKKDGLKIDYYTNGTIRSILPYHNDNLEGEAKYYTPNGKLSSTFQFKKGLRHGVSNDYRDNGDLSSSTTYDYDNMISAVSYHKNGKVDTEITYGPHSRITRSYNEDGELISSSR